MDATKMEPAMCLVRKETEQKKRAQEDENNIQSQNLSLGLSFILNVFLFT